MESKKRKTGGDESEKTSNSFHDFFAHQKELIAESFSLVGDTEDLGKIGNEIKHLKTQLSDMKDFVEKYEKRIKQKSNILNIINDCKFTKNWKPDWINSSREWLKSISIDDVSEIFVREVDGYFDTRITVNFSFNLTETKRVKIVMKNGKSVYRISECSDQNDFAEMKRQEEIINLSNSLNLSNSSNDDDEAKQISWKWLVSNEEWKPSNEEWKPSNEEWKPSNEEWKPSNKGWKIGQDSFMELYNLIFPLHNVPVNLWLSILTRIFKKFLGELDTLADYTVDESCDNFINAYSLKSLAKEKMEDSYIYNLLLKQKLITGGSGNWVHLKNKKLIIDEREIELKEGIDNKIKSIIILDIFSSSLKNSSSFSLKKWNELTTKLNLIHYSDKSVAWKLGIDDNIDIGLFCTGGSVSVFFDRDDGRVIYSENEQDLRYKTQTNDWKKLVEIPFKDDQIGDFLSDFETSIYFFKWLLLTSFELVDFFSGTVTQRSSSKKYLKSRTSIGKISTAFRNIQKLLNNFLLNDISLIILGYISVDKPPSVC
jgi:hypothetical protein